MLHNSPRQFHCIIRTIPVFLGLLFCIQGGMGEVTSISSSPSFLLSPAGRPGFPRPFGTLRGSGGSPGRCRAGAAPAAVPLPGGAFFWGVSTVPREGGADRAAGAEPAELRVSPEASFTPSAAGTTASGPTCVEGCGSEQSADRSTRSTCVDRVSAGRWGSPASGTGGGRTADTRSLSSTCVPTDTSDGANLFLHQNNGRLNEIHIGRIVLQRAHVLQHRVQVVEKFHHGHVVFLSHLYNVIVIDCKQLILHAVLHSHTTFNAS